jgi:hypothetical protein
MKTGRKAVKVISLTLLLASASLGWAGIPNNKKCSSPGQTYDEMCALETNCSGAVCYVTTWDVEYCTTWLFSSCTGTTGIVEGVRQDGNCSLAGNGCPCSGLGGFYPVYMNGPIC